jgi:hypothetical protein
MSEREGETLEYRLKCLNCSLHYSLFSWTRWAEKNELGGFCPECGIRGNKVVYGPVKRDEFIFQLVPGDAPLSGMTRPEDVAPFGLGNMALPEDAPGPYGTNKGDQWLAPGSEIQNRLDADGEGLVLVHWIDDDGEEAVYTTSNPEMIAEAQRGHEQWVAAQARRN